MNDTAFLRKLITEVSDENVELKVRIAELEADKVKLQLRIAELTEIINEADYALESAGENLRGSTEESLATASSN